ncbi:alkaline phosphatase family protein [Bifidobacterium cuniculi]|uniref:Type I phosphodiesterase/nucleotide pyrophosphatase n=1 Tax=Bifidobacterium cuniculi TaxID=1688 RepID=A0A087B3R2_9BIFI|nr:type I phosphodiesterase/nucleotide pyrophosphatase [Bifidobacterium cuniculi]
MIEVPDMSQLLGFVPTAQYGDTLDAGRPCDVPADLPCADRAARGGALHLSSVLPALADAIGAPVSTAVHADGARLRRALGFPQARSAVVVLVDGLGYWNLALRIGHAPYLRSLLRDSVNRRPICTTSPSTTTAALAAFGTGTCPGLTCMTGYTQRNPATDELAQLIAFRNAPSPESLQREPTVFELLAARDVPVTSVGLSRFAFSPFTRAALRGSRYICADTPRDRVRKAAHACAQPGLAYLYLRDVDKTGHANGWDGEDWVAAVEKVDGQLATLRRLLPQGTLMVIVADHGMVESDPSARIDVASDPALMQGVHMLAGEPRSMMVYVEEGQEVQDVADRWRGRLAGRAWVRTRQEAVDAGFFGPMGRQAWDTVGDLVVEAAGAVTLVDSAHQSEGAMLLPGVHGSQTMMEMDIPCLVDMA